MFEVGRDIFKHGFRGVGENSLGHRRLRFIYGIFCVAFIVFAGRTLQLAIQGTDRARLGYARAWEPVRADIVDRNGVILAKNIVSGHIAVRPKLVENKDEVAQFIHDMFPYEYSVPQVLKILDSGRKFYPIKKYATDEQRKMVLDAKLPGLSVEMVEDGKPIQKRKYPKRRLFSHVVGFVGNEGQGLEGVEKRYNDYLSDNREPLQLSLDSRVQSVFYDQLSMAVQKYHARGAMGLLMNSGTGEMIAMVSLPDFDPEDLSMDPVSNRMFMPTRGVFEMGSVFKIFNTALAMENGITKEYYVKAPYKIYDKNGRLAAKPIEDVRSFKPPRPNLSVEEIMLHSCNVGSAQIALDLPSNAQPDFFHKIHLDEALDLEFDKTQKSLMPRKWGPVERATVSFGHGISVTPMHLLLAVNAVTNGGIYIYPTLQKRGYGPLRGERVISEDISARLRQIMLGVVEETSGRKARIPGMRIGGKTGTAEKRTATGQIDKTRNMTVFAGVFPIDAPQYTILVILDEPKGIQETYGLKTSAWNAVPTAGKILEGILPLLFE